MQSFLREQMKRNEIKVLSVKENPFFNKGGFFVAIFFIKNIIFTFR